MLADLKQQLVENKRSISNKQSELRNKLKELEFSRSELVRAQLDNGEKDKVRNISKALSELDLNNMTAYKVNDEERNMFDKISHDINSFIDRFNKVNIYVDDQERDIQRIEKEKKEIEAQLRELRLVYGTITSQVELEVEREKQRIKVSQELINELEEDMNPFRMNGCGDCDDY